MLNLLHHIDKERFEPHVAVLDRGSVWLQDAPSHVKVHELGVLRARRAVFPLARLCRKIRPQAVLSTSAYLNTTVMTTRALLPKGTSRALFYEGGDVLTYEGEDIISAQARGACGRFRFFIYKHVYRGADLVICQSDYMKEQLIRQFGLEPTKVVRIYNPVDIDAITQLAEAQPRPLPDAGPNLVAVGRFSHEKGFDLLLQCTPLVRQAIPTAVLTLVGDGPDLSALRVAQRELRLESGVRFAGLRRNPYPLIKHADLLVLPSRSEALPNVVLEAIALGTPVVATDCTPALGEISSCTRRLRVAKDTTPAALAAEIIHALANSTGRPKAGPEPQFEARFGIRHVIRQYEQALWRSI
jgi:glycosyltransferase involved in cell wall biosynthesis